MVEEKKWLAGESADGEMLIFEEGSNEALAAVFSPGGMRTSPHADLIAKAPEMRSALRWYAAKAKEMQRCTLRGDSKAMLEIMRELSLDGGKQAREAMGPNA